MLYRVLILVFLVIFPSSASAVLTLHSDLDGDGMEEGIVFSPGGEQALRIFRESEEIWRGVPSRWEAWKLVIGDVDGDGVKELLVGVNIRTRFFPNKHRSIFVLGWNGSFAYSRWLGSHMSKPLVDFTALDIDGDGKDELITVEVSSDGRVHLVVYRWVGFGYVVVWQSESVDGVDLIQDGSKVGLRLVSGECLILSSVNGRITLRRCP